MAKTEISKATVSLWPAEPPLLRAMDAPARLMVPVGTRENAAVTPKPPGTAVRRGETLVQATVESSHIGLAPADGIIGPALEVQLTNGRRVAAVELLVSQNGRQNAAVEGQVIGGLADSGPAALVQWIDRLRLAGVCADRHDSPDLIGQLNYVVRHPIEMVLCTVLDTDPGIRLNAALAAQHAQAVVGGLSLLQRLTAARECLIAIERPAAVTWTAPLRAAAKAAGARIVELFNDYPQSDPTLMMYSVVERRLRPGQLPVTQKVLLLDAAAALAVGRAAAGESALLSPLAIHDHINRRTHFLSVPVGTPLKDILALLQITSEKVMLRGGDLLRDVRLTPLAVVGGAELILHISPPEKDVNPEPCIRCAWCIQTCPTQCQPAGVLEAAQRRDKGLAERTGINACLECGLCAHVCPSRLPLLDAIRFIKNVG
jgi:electron transport complex protein RnfC